MKHYRVICSLLALGLSLCAAAARTVQAKEIKKTVGEQTVSIQFYNDNIVRVTKYLGTKQPEKKSYSVIMQPEATGKNALQVNIDDKGAVSFISPSGTLLLREGSPASFSRRPAGVDAGKYEVSQTFLFEKDEAIFGFGQIADEQMNKRGKSIKFWNTNTYTPIPYFASERGYGLFWDNPGRSFFDDTPEHATFRSEVALMVDYYFMYADGSQDGLVDCIRQLTGQATMFPLWAMGHWQCRERYKTSDELAEVLDKYREFNIPLDAIVQDWQYWGCDSNWNAMDFMNPYYINKVGDDRWAKFLPDDLKPLAEEYKAKGIQPRLKSPKEMIDYVHENKAHIMISIWANFGPWTKPFRELQNIGALMSFDTWPRNHGVMPYDAFNPMARDIYWKYLSNLYEMGFDAWWTDSTEPDHFEREGDDDYITHDGSWRSVKNAFPIVTNRGIYEHQRAAEDKKIKKNKRYKGKRSVQMTRSGAFGLQHYGTFSWSGDIQASWQSLKSQVPAGLSYSLCGIPFWNTDIGGFFYWDYWNDPKNPALQELHTRWMQWGTFMPLMRNHGSSPMPTELYHFGKTGDWAYDAQVEAVRLRYRLLPYIYSCAGDCVQRSGTMMRALVMDFPTDKVAINLADEYMFGRQLLVRPVTEPQYTWREDQRHGHQIYPDVSKAAAPVKVYLPKEQTLAGTTVGCKWYDFFTNKLYEGGRTILRPTSILEYPVFVKAGSILPFGPAVQYSSQQAWDELEVRIYPGADGKFILYEDEGDGYNYERGLFSEISFAWNDAEQKLTISARRGSFPGMIAKRRFRVVKVTEQSTRGDQPIMGGRTVDYDGKELSLTL